MTAGALKVLIVDDSAFMRTVIRQIVSTEAGFTVAGEAPDGLAALEALRSLKPDIVTLDVEMPGLDGIGVLKQAEPKAGMAPVFVMVSAFTTAGASLTLSALQAGALDFVPKASENFNVDLAQVGTRLREKLATAAAALRSRGGRSAPSRPPVTTAKGPAAPISPLQASAAQGSGAPASPTPMPAARAGTVAPAPKTARAAGAVTGLRGASQSARAAAPPPVAGTALAPDLVVVAASTGGPQTLPKLLQGLRRYPAPIVIAQHIPPMFSRSLADSLAQSVGSPACEAEDRMQLRPGTIYVLPGGKDGEIARDPQGHLLARLREGGESPYHPSGDLLFRSAALAARRPVGVILTGMGQDGTEGAGALAKRGRPILVQDPSTAILWGMPRSAIDAGVAAEVMAVEDIARRLRELAGDGEA